MAGPPLYDQKHLAQATRKKSSGSSGIRRSRAYFAQHAEAGLADSRNVNSVSKKFACISRRKIARSI